MSESSRRHRTLTEKGQEEYERSVLKFSDKLNNLEKRYKTVILPVSNAKGFEALEKSKNDLVNLKDEYEQLSRDFVCYLEETRTSESLAKLSCFTKTSDAFCTLLVIAVSEIDNRIESLVVDSMGSKSDVKSANSHKSDVKSVNSHRSEVKSVHSNKSDVNSVLSCSHKSHSRVKSLHSHQSKNSSVSVESSLNSAVRLQRAKAEAARAKLDIAKEEAEILKQKAELEARLHILDSKKQLDEAEAELKVLGEEVDVCSVISSNHSCTSEIKKERTQSFVEDQCLRRSFKASPNDVKCKMPLNPNAAVFNPPDDLPNDKLVNTYTDVTKFMLKKELSLNRLSPFDDKVEMYNLWKSGFCDIVRDLELSPNEELDLLIKYLGTESKRQAISIRAANAKYPERALNRVWERLEERFASPELVEASVKKRLADFPKIGNKENKKLYDLSDIVSEIESLKDSDQYCSLFSYFDTSSGVTPIVCKLPYNLQEKWTSRAMDYKLSHGVSYPPFSFFSKFIRDMARMRNDPSFCYLNQPEIKSENTPFTKAYRQTPSKNAGRVTVNKTEADKNEKYANSKSQQKTRHCLYHDSNSHSLNFCRNFRLMPLPERKNFLFEKKACTKCCSQGHTAKQCKKTLLCGICKKSDHVAAMHENLTEQPKMVSLPPVENGGESIAVSSHNRLSSVNSSCTEVCHNPNISKSCAKTLLVRLSHKDKPGKDVLAYAILDDQSNCSLATSKFFEMFNERGPEISYSLRSCAGVVNVAGRKATGYSVQSLDCSYSIDIPLLIECNEIPNNRDEISTPEIASFYPHLSDIAEHIPALNPDSEILLLIGRDVPSAHHVHDQKIGPLNGPFAQKTSLGWTVVGDVCLKGAHLPEKISVSKTLLLSSGRPSLMEPCDKSFLIKYDLPVDPIFDRTKGDEKCGLSIEDKTFLKIMDDDFTKNDNGNWVAPLPFRNGRPKLENNREYVYKRMMSLVKGLDKNPEKKLHMIEFMRRIFECNHAEVAPPISSNDECWYLPLFGVYHPKKPGKVRVVFDSSAKYKGNSLNDVLLTGPDLTNNLLGILLRFRKEAVAMIADVEQMFHNFVVQEDHRNYLRFFWFQDNDPDSNLIEYRMTVHVFGNTPSPAVATYGLRRSVDDAEHDVQQFVNQNFYVDDGLISEPDESTAIDLMLRTQAALRTGGNLRLHKIAANSKAVLDSFPPDDLAKGLKDHDLTDSATLQSSLGLIWDINLDTFTYKSSSLEKPFTRRGILSTINSLYDPIGFVAPVIIQGKIFLREVTSLGYKWDDPLPEDFLPRWESWKDSLVELVNLKIPRMYSNISLSKASKIEMHVFSDASNEAVGAVAYLRVYDSNNMSQVCLLLGKAKIAPQHGHTIPRLELCAAVMAVEIYEIASEHLDVTLDAVQFYSDSKVVLGYIKNEKRRFYVYVSNRVDRIRRSTHPGQWNYVPSNANPADLATRGVAPTDMHNSPWLFGPLFFPSDVDEDIPEVPLLDPDNDIEVRPLVDVKETNVSIKVRPSIIDRLEKFSNWTRLLKSVAFLRHIASRISGDPETCKGWHVCKKYKTPEFLKETELYILKELQHECFREEVTMLGRKSNVPASSSIASLSPYLDEKGILRVGGRLSKASQSHGDSLVHPIIIPRKHFISKLLVRHFHELTYHQGRHLTEGAIRNAGYWVVGVKRLVSSLIHQCVTCRRTRGKTAKQKMGDLPLDRLTPNPPFTFVGVDVFGPWEVTTRRLRGGSAASKRWAVLFSCLVSRAVHIEVIEELSASSFINALRRFIALRGPVKQVRSDRGTNFIGAVKELRLNSVFDEDGPVQRFLSDQGCTWIFNPPHASHMGGSWERMIGIARRILDNMFFNHPYRFLTHEVLVTFMAEVCAIINGRPIVPVSTDPDDLFILSPSLLLTGKLPNGDFSLPDMDIKEAYRSNWKYVQILAEEFWKGWHREYIHNLQPKRKWVKDARNFQTGDVVLMKNMASHRNEWPLGLVVRTFPGDDGLVRKVEVRTTKDGKVSLFIRTINELVHLL